MQYENATLLLENHFKFDTISGSFVCSNFMVVPPIDISLTLLFSSKLARPRTDGELATFSINWLCYKVVIFLNPRLRFVFGNYRLIYIKHKVVFGQPTAFSLKVTTL